ncbi:copper homeostasis protein CutC [Staphylococcus gallinarum]|uniref:copper homeostasis protein CutC n=1 Tax=Staphylococcus gallinarum TaxID=1293 RepID=UPI000D1F9712|nr:copper homeostasis protein CutC [Staphylococcus gallinarum]MCD8819906.1 copper homeostasis protein CutC [Staphylococcus gallinarum]MCQ9287400.1 copper homeostasis protein CutC [Staphylococcus gallinarum]PTL10234.1 copper homeostasis protein CutC [Staphylococcus gallinarum]RIO83036.1 copper homeostasis protein CutC [Staphylococcus gallinarum]
MIKEAVVETIQQVEEAIANGANRIELCDNLAVGGTTPSYGMTEIAAEICHINHVELAVMIRPRGGNFVYSLYDIEIMQRDIKALKSHNVDYFVFGCLTEDSTLNEWQMKTLKQLAAPVQSVCHMAFDEIHQRGQIKALHQLIDLGFTRLLTHGGPAGTNIFDNLNHLGKLVVNSGGKIEIMPGGGVTKDNVQALLDAFPFQEVHGTKIV